MIKTNNEGFWLCSNGIASHFHETETGCKCGCGYNEPNQFLLDKLESNRLNIGKPIVIVSWCRCRDHNYKVGGANKSAHLTGNGVDYYCPKLQLSQLWFFSESYENKMNGLGSYPECENPFIHGDLLLRVSRWTHREGRYWYLF